MWINVGSAQVPQRTPDGKKWDKTAIQTFTVYQCTKCKRVQAGYGGYPNDCCEPCRTCGKPKNGHPSGPQVYPQMNIYPQMQFGYFSQNVSYQGPAATATVVGGDHWYQPERREKARK